MNQTIGSHATQQADDFYLQAQVQAALEGLVAESFQVLDDAFYPAVFMVQAITKRIEHCQHLKLEAHQVSAALAQLAIRDQAARIQGRIARLAVGWTTPRELRRAELAATQFAGKMSLP